MWQFNWGMFWALVAFGVLKFGAKRFLGYYDPNVIVQNENPLADALTASLHSLSSAVSAARTELTDHAATIQRLLKPITYLTECQFENMDGKHLAELSVKFDRLTDAVENAKRELTKQEIEKSRREEEWKQSDADMQTKVRLAKRIQRLNVKPSRENQTSS